jgi:small-conductance mechanosensitive channel
MLSTEFIDLQGRYVSVSNEVLSDKALFNHRKSNPAVVEVLVKLALSTPQRKLDALRAGLEAWTKSEPSTWMPRVDMILNGLEDDASLHVRLRCFNRSTWQDRAIVANRTSLAMQIRSLLIQNNIDAGDAAPIQLV